MRSIGAGMNLPGFDEMLAQVTGGSNPPAAGK
jgi:hypothetical protein